MLTPQFRAWWRASRYIRQAGEAIADRLRERAEAGDVEAQAELGEWYLWVPTVRGYRNHTEAYAWIKRASNQGHEGSRSRLNELFGYPAYGGAEVDFEAIVNQAFIDWAAEDFPVPGDVDLFGPSSDAVFADYVAWRFADLNGQGVLEDEQGNPIERLGPEAPPDPGLARLEAQNQCNLETYRHEQRRLQAAREAAALGGDVKAMVEAGEALLLGTEVPRDVVAAYAHFAAAAEQGHAQAQFLRGAMHHFGLGTPRDEAMALVCYEQAVASGHLWAHRGLGTLYEEGRGARQDMARAIGHYEEALKTPHTHHAAYFGGQADLCVHLGQIYERGTAVPRDLGRAFAWYGRAEGRRGVQLRLGYMLAHGLGVSADPVEALEAYFRAAGMFDYGYGDPLEQAVHLWIGRLFHEGRGLPAEPIAAATLYEGANTPHSLFLFAAMLVAGDGVDCDRSRAVEIAREAAQKWIAQDTRHLWFLTRLPQSAEGVSHLEDALAHLKLAADGGHAAAAFELGWLWLNHPERSKRDETVAASWLAVAADGGHVGARSQLALLHGASAWPAFETTVSAALADVARGPSPWNACHDDWAFPSVLGQPGAYVDARVSLLRVQDTFGKTQDEWMEWLAAEGNAGALQSG